MAGSQELKLLLQRAGMSGSQEEVELVAPLYKGYREQVDALYSLGLEGEEVQGGFMSQELD